VADDEEEETRLRAIDLLGGTEIVSEQDCWDMLATQSVGRLAVSMDGQIEIFPVNYGLDGDGIIFRTNAGRKMTWATGGEVAFEVDSVDENSHCGWSVVVHGAARDISSFDSPERRLAARAWAGEKDFLIRISPRTLTGRRIASLQFPSGA
jgi:nitroimidazol reductase NimA-like FMN-containing flavoprotein (pyridoxamine 5'-phosphate oxidase superfamily)